MIWYCLYLGAKASRTGPKIGNVHWLRHTAISEDVKRRPLNHVRDDAGHESINTTNRYINTPHRERHKTARDKPIMLSED